MPKVLENPKQKLIETARHLLTTEGIGTFNIRQVTKASGIALGTFYNYYQDKNQLLAELFREDFMPVLTVLKRDAADQSISFKALLHNLFVALGEFLRIYQGVFSEMAASMQVHQGHKEKEKLMGLQGALATALTHHKETPLRNSALTADQMSYLILQNFLFLLRDDEISFDQWYRQIFS